MREIGYGDKKRVRERDEREGKRQREKLRARKKEILKDKETEIR